MPNLKEKNTSYTKIVSLNLQVNMTIANRSFIEQSLTRLYEKIDFTKKIAIAK
jgi:hypothetical protein